MGATSTPTANGLHAFESDTRSSTGSKPSPSHPIKGRDAVVDFEEDGSPPALRTVRSSVPIMPVLLQDSLFRTAARNFSLIALWYFFSTLLSVYNKSLMGKENGLLGRGPFPAPLLFACVQFVVQYTIANAMLALGMVRRQCTDKLPWDEYLRTIVPNGVSTGLDIGLSIFSFRYITLSFYTMCKATSPLFLLFFAVLWGIEKLSWALGAIVSTIIPGLVLLVWGEQKFDMAGFVLVMSASAMSGLRWTYTQVQLQGGGSGGHGFGAKTGGPVEVLAQLTPVAAITVGVLSLMFEHPWSLGNSPYFDSPTSIGLAFCIMGGGGAIAFLMVWTEFQVIAFTSALTLMVAGTFKEIVTVVAGVGFFGDPFHAINAVGLLIVMAGVVMYNVYKYNRMRAGELVAKGSNRDSHSSARRPSTQMADMEELMPIMQASNNGGNSHDDRESPRTIHAPLGSDLIKKKRMQAEAEIDR